MRRALATLPMLIVGLACAGPTELVVFIDTDIPLGPRTESIAVADDELRFLTIGLECFGVASDPECDIMDRGTRLSGGWGQDYSQIGGGIAPPFYLGVLREGDLDREVRIEVEGLVGPTGSERVVRSSARVRFVPGRASTVVLIPRVACIGVVCAIGETCSGGGVCVPEERPEADLPEWLGECTDFSLPQSDGTPGECDERVRTE